MRRYIGFLFTFITLICVSVSAHGQKRLSAKEMIAITPIVCDAMEIHADAKRALDMKLMQVVTANGFGSTSQRYALTPNLVTVDKQIAATTPAMYKVQLELSLYVVDVVENVIISQTSVPLVGVDAAESKAYIKAINMFNARSAQMVAFMDKSRSGILDYYATRTPELLTKATSLSDRGLYDEAIEVLTVIPESVDDYSTVATAMVDIYKKKVDRDAATYLASAKRYSALGEYDNAMSELLNVEPLSNHWDSAKNQIERIKSNLTEARKAEIEAKYKAELDQAEKAEQQIEEASTDVVKSQDLWVEAARQSDKVAMAQSGGGGGGSVTDSLNTFATKVNDWYISMFV